jgi:hypothetical protein
MSTIEDRLSALESAMEDVKRQLAGRRKPRAWLDDVAGSLEPWPEFEEVLRLGRESRAGVTDPDDAASRGA